MLLHSIVLHNVGVFRGEHVVDLCPKDDRRVVTLIGGLNGCGKTTLLESVLLALYGKLSPVVRESGVAYPEYLRRLINRGVAGEEGAGVQVLFSAHRDGRECTFRVCRAWTHKRGRIQERLDVLADGQHDPFMSDHWLEVIESFIPAGLAHLFFFDGERIEQLADPRRSPELISSALHALLGVDIIEQLESDLTVLARRKRKAMRPDQDRKMLQSREKEIEQLHERRASLKQDIAATTDPLRRAELAVEEFEREFRKQGGELAASREELARRESAVEESLANVSNRLRTLAAGALPMLLVRSRLEVVGDRASAEEEHLHAERTAALLLKRDETLLKEFQSGGLEDAVLRRIERAFREDRERRAPDPGFEALLQLPPGAASTVKSGWEHAEDERDEALELLSQHARMTGERDATSRSLAACPDDEVLGPVSKRLKQSMETVADQKARRDQLQRDLTDIERKYAVLERALDRMLREQGALSIENDDAQRVVSHIERAAPLLESFRARLIEQHLDRIGQLIHEGFTRLLRKECLVSAIQIESGSCELTVLQADGKRLPAERLSAGERQLLATSILWGFARAAGRPLPVFIDTPLGRLDSDHRRHFVERYLPFASHQVIVLSTDEEIDADVFDALKPCLAHSYILKHDDATATTRIEEGYFWEEVACGH